MTNTKFVERWHSDAFEDREIALQIYKDLKKTLKVMPHPFTGWRSFPNQKLRTVEINENGLRSPSLQKLKSKKNCFLLGGSVAWGFGASSNDNIPSSQIEKILKNKYNIDYNIINLSEQGYTSYEEVSSFIFSLHELNPSMIIILGGTNDINAEYDNSYKKMSLYEDLTNFYLWGDKLGVFRERNFFKLFLKFFLRFYKKDIKINNEFYYYKKPQKHNISLDLYNMKIDFIKNYCFQKKIPVFNFLQPDLFFKKNKSEFETKYEIFEGDERKKFTISKLNKFEKEFFSMSNNTNFFKNLSLLSCFDDYSKTLFVDRFHVSDIGYKIISEQICSFINRNKNIII
jgi:lysophospholipase L1-like esterase